jgi:hypothetical protein
VGSIPTAGICTCDDSFSDRRLAFRLAGRFRAVRVYWIYPSTTWELLMTTNLSDGLRQAIEERGGAPVYGVDATTNASYVLMRAEQFEEISALVDGNGVEAMCPLLADIEPDDWEDISHYDRNP